MIQHIMGGVVRNSQDDMYAMLNSRPGGLSDAEARERLLRHGRNELKHVDRFGLLRLILRQFTNVFLLLLLFAAGVSWLTGAVSDGWIIAAIVGVNALIGFVQEYRAEQSLRSLQSMMAPLALVLRDGTLQRLSAALIVPGDVVRVEAGDRIPADGVVIESINAMVNESPLTGESVPVPKRGATSPTQIGGEESVFLGTSVSAGRLLLIVTATGMNTRVGAIARVTTEITAEKSPLQAELDRIGRRIAWASGVIFLAVFLVIVARSGTDVVSWRHAFLFAVALAVAIVPEGLPATVTVGLSLGMRKMARKGAVIRKLSAVETLGCVTVICTDKTGTLTRNEMTVRNIFVPGTLLHVSGTGYDLQGEFTGQEGAVVDVRKHQGFNRLLELGVLCNNASSDQKTAVGDPTELALLVAARKSGIDLEALHRAWPRGEEIPFDSDRRMMTTVHRDAGSGAFVAVTKGAPDAVLARCSAALDWTQSVALDSEIRDRIDKARHLLTTNAMRVIALAFRPLPEHGIGRSLDVEENMTFVGLVGMADPPRPDAAGAVQSCRNAGIRVIMTTGDQKETALAIARETGITPGERAAVVSGDEMRKLDDGQLDALLSRVHVYAQISPEDKMRIVEGLRRRGEIVAMTGDGVNDAPALKRADIGVAMGRSGTDIAKDASEMVITDDSFATIADAVMEGRTVYDNVRKFILYAFSGIAAEFLVVVFSLLPGIGMLLSAIQILWIDLGTEVLPALALSFDPPAPDVMSRHPRRRDERLIGRSVLLRVAFNSTVIACGAIALFFAYRGVGAGGKAATVPFAAIILFQMVNVFTCRNLERPTAAFSLRGNPQLLGAVGISTAATVALISFPPAAKLFHSTPLSPGDWILTACAATSILVCEGLRRALIRFADQVRPLGGE